MVIQDRNISLTRQFMTIVLFDSKGVADPDVEIQFGPNIKDWPEMAALPENLIVRLF